METDPLQPVLGFPAHIAQRKVTRLHKSNAVRIALSPPATQWEHPGIKHPSSAITVSVEPQTQTQVTINNVVNQASRRNVVPVDQNTVSQEWNVDMSTLEGQLSRVRQISETGHPRMTVTTDSKLEKMKRLPRSSEGLADDLE